MNTERTSTQSDVQRRVDVHAALADATRLQVVDLLMVSDASSSELGAALGVPSNLLAHHLKTLESVGLLARRRSEGDGRRTYWRLRPEGLQDLGTAPIAAPRRLVFVCTANSARSHLAAALWAQASPIPVASAGTHPAERIDPGAIAAAERHDVALLPGATPQVLSSIEQDGDLVVTVCDRAHEELDLPAALHWSIPDPVAVGSPAVFDDAVALLTERVGALVPRLDAAS
ncbi:helix-turn-helix domain-containing protein [Nocardioides sp. 1609]|uniref:arsenate reductase/protein-tyrosine-phosphatase family protein n=1 Tax=Nocardioides sp. 1609 TaxID=2508327 RepID=UPI00107006D3|nr:helix-turn-helix domain-containing protein [Nocardioides sp. 1609]